MCLNTDLTTVINIQVFLKVETLKFDRGRSFEIETLKFDRCLQFEQK